MPKKQYFSHDYNARNDKKIAALVREFKSAGYGIFWCTAEMLHEEGGEIELDDLTISAISKDLNEDFDFVKTVIHKCCTSFKLLNLSDNNVLTGNRVKRNLDKRDEISKVRSDAGKISAIAKQMQANAQQMLPIAKQVSTNVQQNSTNKRNKIKEIKEKKEIKIFNTMPTAEMFNGLPEIKSGAVIQLFKISKQTDVTHDDVSDLWEVFKVQNLTGAKYYKDENDVYSHFINWSKMQSVVSGAKSGHRKKYSEKTKEEIDMEVKNWLQED